MPAHRKENPSYNAIHAFLRRNFPKTGCCEHCGRNVRTHYAAKDHNNYTRNREDYMELCSRCHLAYDGITPPSQKGRKISADHIAALQAGRARQRALVAA